MFFVVLGAIVVLVIMCFVAAEFSNIAISKGHDGSKYFWIVLLLGVIGMLMVVALPDKRFYDGLRRQLEELAHQESAKPETPPVIAKQTNEEPRNERSEAVEEDPEIKIPKKAVISGDEKICPSCGTAQRITRKICWKCGQVFEMEA